ncbi:MAG: PRC-barrel domain-containing protein [Actinomycetota bacterium]|nr:PRC-barrel domain-containing protein [Actinomycetota bacterium]
MTDNEAPVSWITLEKGTRVLSADGEELGAVAEVIADGQKDIFSGLTISSGLFSSDRFAPADVVGDMTADAVTLTINSAEAEKLEVYEG